MAAGRRRVLGGVGEGGRMARGGNRADRVEVRNDSRPRRYVSLRCAEQNYINKLSTSRNY